MKTLSVAALLIVTLALPVAAFAQGGGLAPRKDDPPVNPETKRAQEKAYSDSLSNIKVKEYDPWAGVREKEPAKKPQAPTPKKKPPVRPFVE